jgi:hypothetical protein
LENASWLSQKLVPAAVVYFAWSDRKEKDEFLNASAKANATLLAKVGKSFFFFFFKKKNNTNKQTTAHLSTFSNQTPVDFTVGGSSSSTASASDKVSFLFFFFSFAHFFFQTGERGNHCCCTKEKAAWCPVVAQAEKMNLFISSE